MATRKSNVLSLPRVELPGLGIAATSGEGNRIKGSRNEIWLCPAYTGTEGVMLYLKLSLSTRAMLVESVCAQLANCLGLEAPRPFLVTVQPRHVGRPNGPPMLTFGAEDLSTRSMARPLRNLDMLLALLRSHRIADLCSAFDEWIGNDVRSPSDILVSPEPRIYMIDHEAALAPGLTPEAAVTNWLAARLLEGLSDTQRVQFMHQVRGRLAALQRIDLSVAPGVVQFAQDGVPLYTGLLQFLRERLTHLDRLLSERVLPEQRYLITYPTEDAPPKSQSDAAG